MDPQHMLIPCKWSPRLLQVLIIFASLASPSLSEFTSAPGFTDRRSRFVEVDEESVHPSASRRLEKGKSGINIPLEEVRVANVDQHDVYVANPSNLQQLPDTSSYSSSLVRKILGSHPYYTRKLSSPGGRPPPSTSPSPPMHGRDPPPGAE